MYASLSSFGVLNEDEHDEDEQESLLLLLDDKFGEDFFVCCLKVNSFDGKVAN